MEVFKIMDIQEFRKTYKIPRAVVIDYKVAYDNKIYLLMMTEKDFSIKEKVKWGIGIKDQYHFFCIDFDWEAGAVKKVEPFSFNHWDKRIHYWCPLQENFLLVRARANSKDRVKNAYVVDKNGTVLKGMHFGDGINECYTTPNGRIITSYIDEGIFREGNWPAESGVTMWDENGKSIWKNRKYDIWHTCAMNLDPMKRLWFYYYGSLNEDYDTMFHLVCSRKEGDLVFAPDIRSSRGFAVTKDYKKLFLGGGYKDESSVYVYDMDCTTQKLTDKKKVIFESDEMEIKSFGYKFSEDKVFLFTPEGRLFAGQLK